MRLFASQIKRSITVWRLWPLRHRHAGCNTYVPMERGLEDRLSSPVILGDAVQKHQVAAQM
jgi:hypothetical protein